MKFFLILIILQIEGAQVTLWEQDSKPACERERQIMSEKISEIYKNEFEFGRKTFPPYTLGCVPSEPKPQTLMENGDE